MTLPTVRDGDDPGTDADNVRDDSELETYAVDVRHAGVRSAGNNVRDGGVPEDPHEDPLPNQAPVAVMTIDASASVADPVVVDTTGTSDGDGTIHSGVLNWGDGTTVSFVGAPEATYSHTYAAVGTYTITLTVIDNDFAGDAATAVITFVLANQPPTAQLTFVSGDFTGDLVVLSTTGTEDPDGTLASWEMDFDDGAPETGVGDPPATLDHTYGTAGTYTGTFTVTDTGGLEASVTMEIVVQDPLPGDPPDTTFSLSSGAFLGDSFVFAIDGSDPDLGTVTWTLNYGDGSIAATGTGADLPTTRSRTYTAAGVYSAVFRVTDTEALTTTKTIAVAVVEEVNTTPPVAVLTYVSGQYRGEAYVLSTVGTEGDLASGSLGWGDGSASDTWTGFPDPTYSHTYANAGTYTATLTVVDSEGTTASASRQVQISSVVPPNQPPIARLTKIGGNTAGDTFTFSTSGTSDPDGSLASWTFTSGTGSSGTGHQQAGPGSPPATITVVYSAAGSFVATLTVTDTQASTTQDTESVTVGTVTPPPDPTAHGYFNTLAALPQRFGAWSLRSQTQLNSLVNRSPSVFWTYIFGSDPYSDPQDGAKLFKPPRDEFSSYPDLAVYGDSGDEGVAGNNTLRFPLGMTSGSIFLTWDLWWGEEFRTNKAPGSFAFKVWFLFCGDAIGATKNYFCMHERYTGSPLPVAGVVSRHHDGPGGGSQLPLTSGIVDIDPFQPTGQSAAETGTFLTYDSKWTRYWLEIKLAQSGAAFTEWSDTYLSGAALSGTYDMVSLWMADEDRARARVLYRVPFKRPLNTAGTPYAMLSAFRWSWDTSTNNLGGLGLVGPLVCYGRNMVILHNYPVSEGDASLWPKPF